VTDREMLRRFVHVGFGVGAWLLPVVGWQVMAGVCVAGVLFNGLLLPRLVWTRGLLREGSPSGHRGLVFYPLVLLVLILACREHHAPVQIAWCALAFGDGLAPMFGRWLRTPAWPWNGSKSVTASVMSFVVAGLAAQTLVPPSVVWGALAIAVLAESLPGPVDDNLTVPVAGAVAAIILGASG